MLVLWMMITHDDLLQDRLWCVARTWAVSERPHRPEKSMRVSRSLVLCDGRLW